MAPFSLLEVLEMDLLHRSENKLVQNPVRIRVHNNLVYAKLTANNGLSKPAR